MRYNPALDGIRALAVLAVVCHHAFVPGFENGRSGVDVFFVLSGFLITSLLAAEQHAGGIKLGAFYLRRARRLYPALLLMVGLVMAFAPLWGAHAPTGADASIAVFYLSDYAAAYGHLSETIKHTWSLAVEEHFYLLWPLCVMALCRMPRRTALSMLVLGYIVATGWRLHVADNAGDWIANYRFDTRLSGLLLGSLLAFLPARKGWGWAVLPLGMLTALSTDPMGITNIRAEWLGAALVMWARSGAELLTWRPLPYLGRISYGLYLFHWPIAMLFRESQTWPVILVASLGGGLVLASTSYGTVERAFRQRRRVGPAGATLGA
jgi:peptidoglycan/LPS O-acetylase OafA/YrhL